MLFLFDNWLEEWGWERRNCRGAWGCAEKTSHWERKQWQELQPQKYPFPCVPGTAAKHSYTLSALVPSEKYQSLWQFKRLRLGYIFQLAQDPRRYKLNILNSCIHSTHVMCTHTVPLGIASPNYGGWEVPSKLEAQKSPKCHSTWVQRPENQEHQGGMGASPDSVKGWCWPVPGWTIAWECYPMSPDGTFLL